MAPSEWQKYFLEAVLQELVAYHLLWNFAHGLSAQKGAKYRHSVSFYGLKYTAIKPLSSHL